MATPLYGRSSPAHLQPVPQFDESLVSQGIDGGKQAAKAIRQSVESYLGDHPDEPEIICRVYANASGLGRAMYRAGCLENESVLRDFTLGFTQAKASFDFIDVGYGKERADSKIRGKH